MRPACTRKSTNPAPARAPMPRQAEHPGGALPGRAHPSRTRKKHQISCISTHVSTAGHAAPRCPLGGDGGATHCARGQPRRAVERQSADCHGASGAGCSPHRPTGGHASTGCPCTRPPAVLPAARDVAAGKPGGCSGPCLCCGLVEKWIPLSLGVNPPSVFTACPHKPRALQQPNPNPDHAGWHSKYTASRMNNLCDW